MKATKRAALRPLGLAARFAVTGFVCLMATGCAGESSELDRSCGGQIVGVCNAREWAEPLEGSLLPSGLRVADFSQTADIRVELLRCRDAPAQHAVDLAALVPSADGGPALRLINLLTLREGENGDTVGDDVIEVSVANPLLATVPAETDIVLRFTARSISVGGCASGTYEVTYRTGERFVPDEP